MVGDRWLRVARMGLGMTVVSVVVLGPASAQAGASAQRHCPSVFGGAPSAPIAYRPGFVHVTVANITCAQARPVIFAAFRSPTFAPPKPWHKRAIISGRNSGEVIFSSRHKHIGGWVVN
jgi:hypothetical protein